MASQKERLNTIGYEGASLEDFLATLIAAEVRCLLDVRELPISRRKGFAKTALAEALANIGIQYVHFRGLGDPKSGREAARRKDDVAFRKIFLNHLKTETAQADLQEASKLIMAGGSCLMCFERDPHVCHREMVAKAVSDTLQIEICHLGVRVGIAQRDRRFSQTRPRKSARASQGAAPRR